MHRLGSPDKQKSDSQPDLSKINEYLDKKMMLRSKRKLVDRDDEVKAEISELRTDLMSFLTEFDKKQDEKMKLLHSDMTKTIKEEISSIRTSVAELRQEQHIIKNDITYLKEIHLAYDQKIKDLELNFEQLKCEDKPISKDATTPQTTCENIVSELQDRAQREKNIILVGLKEPLSSVRLERIKMEKIAVTQVLTKCYPGCPDPVKIIRLGKYNSEKHRPLKVCFENTITRTQILRNKSMIPDIKVYADQTPLQQEHFKELRLLLQKRQLEGESDIGIKYHNGVPKIMKLHQKNLTALLIPEKPI